MPCSLKLAAARKAAWDALQQMQRDMAEALLHKRQGKQVARYIRADWLGQVQRRTSSVTGPPPSSHARTSSQVGRGIWRHRIRPCVTSGADGQFLEVADETAERVLGDSLGGLMATYGRQPWRSRPSHSTRPLP